MRLLSPIVQQLFSLHFPNTCRQRRFYRFGPWVYGIFLIHQTIFMPQIQDIPVQILLSLLHLQLLLIYVHLQLPQVVLAGDCSFRGNPRGECLRGSASPRLLSEPNRTQRHHERYCAQQHHANLINMEGSGSQAKTAFGANLYL